MLEKSLSVTVILLSIVSMTACSVDKTQEGSLTVPKYEVAKTQEGNVTLPQYEVKTPDVTVSKEEKTIVVPTVKTEERKIEVPTVHVTPASEKN